MCFFFFYEEEYCFFFFIFYPYNTQVKTDWGEVYEVYSKNVHFDVPYDAKTFWLR